MTMILSNKKYSTQQRIAAKEMYMNNLNLAEIAQKLHVKRSTIGHWCRSGAWEAEKLENEMSEDISERAVAEAIRKFESKPTTMPDVTKEEQKAANDIVQSKLAQIAETKVKQIEAVQNIHKGAMSAIGLLIKQTIDDLNAPVNDKDPDKAKAKAMRKRESAAKVFQNLGLNISEIAKANGMHSPQIAIQNNDYRGNNKTPHTEEELLDDALGDNMITINIFPAELPQDHDERAKIIEADAVIETDGK